MIKKSKKNKMTIDDLAIMMANSFDGIEQRMTTKEDLKNLEAKLTKEIGDVKNHIEGTNRRIDDFAETKIDKTVFKGLEKRVDTLEKNLK